MSDTIAAVLRAQAALGERPLLVADGDRLTYAQAELRSRHIAAGLLQAGAGRGSHVALLFGNGVEFALAFLAITRIGAVAVPLSTMSTASELQGLLRGADVEPNPPQSLHAAQRRGSQVRVVVPQNAAVPDRVVSRERRGSNQDQGDAIAGLPWRPRHH